MQVIPGAQIPNDKGRPFEAKSVNERVGRSERRGGRSSDRQSAKPAYSRLIPESFRTITKSLQREDSARRLQVFSMGRFIAGCGLSSGSEEDRVLIKAPVGHNAQPPAAEC